MDWLNYHHLHYFWRVAEAGGLQKAAKALRLTHSTLSTQLKALEGYFGGQLFERRGRSLVLTPLGEQVKAVADDIFRLGQELIDLSKGQAQLPRRSPLRVGVLESIPKTLVYRMLEPTLREPTIGPLVVSEHTLTRVTEALASGRVHVVLTDQPLTPTPGLLVHSHPLGASGVMLYGKATLVRRLREGFPHSLTGAPMLLPASNTSLRRQLDRWFIDQGVRPHVVGEFHDSAALRTFGSFGEGLFPVRSALRTEVEVGDVAPLGTLEGLKERYYAVSLERKLRHFGVVSLVTHTRRSLRAAGLTAD